MRQSVTDEMEPKSYWSQTNVWDWSKERKLNLLVDIRKPINSDSGIKKLAPQLQLNNKIGGRYVNNSKPDYRNSKNENAVFQQSIIDNEKLKRMDDFDRELNDDDFNLDDTSDSKGKDDDLSLNDGDDKDDNDDLFGFQV